MTLDFATEARRYEDAWRPAPLDFFQQRATKFFSAADGRAQWARQGGLDALTGWPLSQDADTENDHVIPKSKGGSDYALNRQWLGRVPNRAAGGLMKSEFIEMCCAVADLHRVRLAAT
jgi:hypothetical protein